MERSFFLEKIRESYRNYGDDPWIFLRELAQNSRDSGAGEIRIDVGGFGEYREVIIFADNGKGMTFKDAEKYLFRLYSSSKSNEKYSLGMYGVGFWSVMKFSPVKILIESYSEAEEKWGIEIGNNLEYRKVECRLEKYGTRITLVRKAKFGNFDSFTGELKKGILKYCSHLEKPETTGVNIQVIFRGQHISEALESNSGISLKYAGKDFEGLVSFENKPKVSIFTGGIPAWEGTSINELSLINKDAAGNKGYIDSGIAPVFVINGRGIKVNIDRKNIIENSSLKRIVKRSEKALDRLIGTYVDFAYPRNRFEKTVRVLKTFFRSIFSSYLKLIPLILLFVIPLEFIIINNVFNNPLKKIEQNSNPRILNTRGYKYYKPIVEKIGDKIIADISYFPDDNILFKMFSADIYKRGKGFIRSNAEVKTPLGYFQLQKNKKPFFINLNVRNRGEIFLPVPEGYGMDETSLSVNGKFDDKPAVLFNKDHYVLKVMGNSEIKYTVFPVIISKKLSRRDLNRYMKFPRSVMFDDKIELILKKNLNKSLSEKVDLCRRITNILLKYDNSPETAYFYRFSDNFDDWLKNVIEIGAGDCDVINGVNALLLRKIGIPSKVIVGLTGINGRVLPNLHAWTQYYDGMWKNIDVSATSKIIKNGVEFRKRAGAEDVSGSVRVFRKPLEREKAGIIEIFFFLIIILAIPAFLIIRNLKRKREDISSGLEYRNRAQVKQDIAGIARSFLLNPDLWGKELKLSERKIITTLQGGQLSIRELIKLANNHQLFTGRKDNPFVRELINSKNHILDSNDKIFEPVIEIIPGVIDLDMIYDIGIKTDIGSMGKNVSVFLSKINKILKKVGNSGVVCLYAPELSGQSMIDIDLTGIEKKSFFDRFKLPKKFIAINPKSVELKDIFFSYEENSYLSVFRLIGKIVNNSAFFVNDPDSLERISIRIILEEGI